MSQIDSGLDERPGRIWPKVARSLAGVRVDVSFALIDALIVISAYTLALIVRFFDRQAAINPEWWDGFFTYLPAVIAMHLLANTALGAYGHVWEYASVEEAMRLVLASVLSAFMLIAGLLFYQDLADARTRLIPLTVVLIGSGTALGLMGVVRFRSRLFSFRRTYERDMRRVLVVGTGREAADLARRGNTAHPPVVVVGFIHHDSSSRRLAGMRVVGCIADLPALIENLAVDEVVVAAGAGPSTVREVVDACINIDVRLRTLPDIDSVMGSASMSDIRDVELADLLPRSTVSTDLGAVAEMIRGKRVLVTGAGGSIGSEIVRQVCGFEPAEVVALDHDEGHLYEASLGWNRCEQPPTLCLADICDRPALQRGFAVHEPEIVFHSAAHKQVPMLELFPEEAVKTNVVGTSYLIDAARRSAVERFVLISTDKAVNPSSVMGASKRVAEMMIQSAASLGGDTVFSSVRFGNVLGSRGSVIPTFMQQIKSGGPVTVSDPNMLRYFMLTGEAVELVLQAAALAAGGEIFVLDMGEPIRIGDLAHRIIRLAGLVPGRDIAIDITGIRPGEKLAEVLSHTPLEPSSHPQISLAAATHPEPETMLDAVHLLERLVADGNRGAIREMVMALAWRSWDGYETIDLSSVPSNIMWESA